MQWVRGWLMSVAGTVVFGVLCEMLLPEGGMKKYVRPVLGMLLVIAVAKPLTALRGAEQAWPALSVTQSEAYAQHSRMEQEQRAQVLSVYTERLRERLTAAAQEACAQEARVEEARVAVSEQEETFGEIRSVTLTLVLREGQGRDAARRVEERLKEAFGVEQVYIRTENENQKGGG